MRELQGIYVDGSEDEDGERRWPHEQGVNWPRAEPGTLRVEMAGQDGQVLDVSGWTAPRLLLVKFPGDVVDGEPIEIAGELETTEGDPLPAPAAFVFEIGADDTAALSDGIEYRFEVRATDEDDEERQVVPPSTWKVGLSLVAPA